MEDRLIYPTEEVPLLELVRAALAECGRDHVAVVTGVGAQVVRVPEACAERVEQRAGLTRPVAAPVHREPRESGTGAAPESEAVGSDSPGSGAQPEQDDEASSSGTAPGRPAGRAAGRPAKKTTARRTPRRKEE